MHRLRQKVAWGALAAMTLTALFLAFAVRSIASPAPAAAAATHPKPDPYNAPFRVMDRHAKLARQGSEADIRAITSQIFTQMGISPQLASAYGFSERVVQADLNYRRGYQDIPVRESDIVTALNNLNTTIGGPAWATTNLAEVRRLRMGLIALEPHFLASQAPPDSKGHYRALEDTMSPLQAVYVASMLIQQKLDNPDYQFTDAEKTQPAFADPVQRLQQSRQRTAALQNAIMNSSQHSLRDLLHDADGFFTDLRIAPLPDNAEVTQ